MVGAGDLEAAEVWTCRERVMTALSLKEPDRVPLDLGGLRDSAVTAAAYERLGTFLGIEVADVSFMSRRSQTVFVEEQILDVLAVDTRPLCPGEPESLCSGSLSNETWRDAWGVEWYRPEGSLYWELKRSPLGGDVTTMDVLHYPWPDPHAPGVTEGLEDRLCRWRETTDCAVVLNLPSPLVHISQFLRGFETWYTDIVCNQALLESLLDACLEVNLAFAREVLAKVGRGVDVVRVPDDLGTQSGLQFSPNHYRKLFKPRHAKYLEVVHSCTDAKVLFHSCGSVHSVIGDLIDIGVDVLNPVQPRASGMDPGRLKREFGRHIAFWGAIDVQGVMPFGSEAEVRAEVQRRFMELGEGGGWVLAPAQNLQADVPPQNIVSLYKAGRELTYRS